jgi:hypothetical protein
LRYFDADVYVHTDALGYRSQTYIYLQLFSPMISKQRARGKKGSRKRGQRKGMGRQWAEGKEGGEVEGAGGKERGDGGRG